MFSSRGSLSPCSSWQRAMARNVLHPLDRKLQYCSSVSCWRPSWAEHLTACNAIIALFCYLLCSTNGVPYQSHSSENLGHQQQTLYLKARHSCIQPPVWNMVSCECNMRLLPSPVKVTALTRHTVLSPVLRLQEDMVWRRGGAGDMPQWNGDASSAIQCTTIQCPHAPTSDMVQCHMHPHPTCYNATCVCMSVNCMFTCIHCVYMYMRIDLAFMCEVSGSPTNNYKYALFNTCCRTGLQIVWHIQSKFIRLPTEYVGASHECWLTHVLWKNACYGFVTLLSSHACTHIE